MNTHPRRGILLLVVLSLLSLFVLIGVTFIVVAGQYRRGSISGTKMERTGDAPEKIAHGVLMQLLRDTSELTSTLSGHSLLGDLYGNDWTYGQVGTYPATGTPAEETLGGKLWRIKVGKDSPSGATSLKLIPHYYDGRTITFLDGDFEGQSARIVDYQVLPGSDGVWGSSGDDDNQNGTDDIGEFAFGVGYVHEDTLVLIITPLDGDVGDVQVDDQFLIGGAPFNGTGVGMNSTTAASLMNPLDALHDTDGYHLALLPRYVAIDQIDNTNPDILGWMDTTGGTDEPWDAVDYQNMFLARNPADLNGGLPVIPSFHRPALLEYWFNELRQTGQLLDGLTDAQAYTAFFFPFGQDNYPGLNPQSNQNDDEQLVDITNASISYMDVDQNKREKIVRLKEALMFRPLAERHSNFTGSNPSGSFAAYGNYDDTTQNWEPRDGQWDIDNDGDGVVDSIWLDLNLPTQTKDGRVVKPLVAILCQDLDGKINLNTATIVDKPPAPSHAIITDMTEILPGTPTDAPYGFGYGPAEIDPGELVADLSNLGRLLDERYRGTSDTVPGETGDDHALVSSWEEANQGPYGPGDSSFRTHPDFRGRVSILATHWGQPYLNYDGSLAPLAMDYVDDPYELNLLRPNSNDTFFSLYDLEQLLRYNDVDRYAGSGRITDDNYGEPGLIGESATQRKLRRLFTTRSFHIPTLPRMLNRDQREWMNAHPTSLAELDDSIFVHDLDLASPTLSFLDYVFSVLHQNGVPHSHASQPDIPEEMRVMLPMEIRRGQKMNINRLFGDGIEDNSNSNSIVDEPGEFQAAAVREFYIQQLYCLMMFLQNPDDFVDFDGDGSADLDETARGYAQWAVNVADFRDADSIMTRFVYDPNPYDGWDTTGTDYVWGCERPELIITETLAWHDRRTEDREDEEPEDGEVAATTTDANNPDMDFDQRFRPRGAFFVELFNPWLAAENAPADLSDASGVELDRKAGMDPVWRLLITKPILLPPPQDSYTYRKLQEPEDDAAGLLFEQIIERSVYFASPGAATDDDGDATNPTLKFNSTTSAKIAPGRYAVIGGGKFDGTRYVSQVGRRTDDDPAVRQIVLQTGSVSSLNNEVSTWFDEPEASEIQPPVVVPVITPRPLTISEPVGGYPAADADGMAYDDGTGYAKPYDRPFDYYYQDDPAVFKRDGTQQNYRTVYLQRLANPLIAWNATDNPYLTVDQMPVDLTVFNGQEAATDPSLNPDGPGEYRFSSVQRGDDDATTVNRRFWPAIDGRSPPTGSDTTAHDASATDPVEVVFRYNVKHTLGYLDNSYWPMLTGAVKGAPEHDGTPTGETFPMFTWLDRPFANPLELLYVPKTSSADLLDEFTVLDPLQDPYGAGGDPIPAFGHLTNYFAADAAVGEAPHFYRIFDYVETPSPYVGTSTWLDLPLPEHEYIPVVGYEDMPAFREPGRVNLNTLHDEEVWQAIARRFPEHLSLWNSDVLPSLENYDGTINPTDIGAPIRPAFAADLLPDVPDAGTLLPDNEVAATLLRPNSAGNAPLFEDDNVSPTSDASRSPWSRYLGLSRLGNMVSNQSNVYAIWITIGYFEYDEATGLGQEAGMDTGDIHRHRMFYVVDRSIPVAFEPGKDHDVQKTILLKRRIE